MSTESLPGQDLAVFRPARVNFLISGLMFGGGQRVVLDLLQQMRGAPDVDAKLVLLGGGGTPLAGHAAAVVPYDGRYNRPITLFGAARRLRRILAAQSSAILHTHGWDADIIGWLAIRGTDIRHIIHLHVTPEWPKSRSIRHTARRRLTRRMFGRPGTHLVAVSDAVRQHWARLLPCAASAITVVRNGIDVQHYRPAQPSSAAHARALVVGTAARLAPMKGLSYLLEAIAVLASQGRTVPLRIAGDGELRQSLEAHARRLGIAAQVEFLGHILDAAEFYRSIDVFVLPSLTEGFPLTILEAMASGCTIVTTSAGGIPEAIRHGVDGLVVPPGDTQALAASLRQVLEDRELRARLSASALDRVREHFSLEAFGAAILTLYRETASDPVATRSMQSLAGSIV